MLRWQSHKGMSWQRLRASKANVAKVQYHEAAVHLIQSVTYGKHLLHSIGSSSYRMCTHISAPIALKVHRTHPTLDSTCSVYITCNLRYEL